MKIAVGGILHETNTFAEGLTEFKDFAHPGGHPPLQEGDSMISAFAGVNLGIGGILAAASDLQVETAPLLWAFPQPAGIVSRAAWNRISSMFLERLEKVMPVDGVALDMHGAMITEDCDDAEGDLFERIRKITGRSVPLAAVLDLHANITPKMAEYADALVGYDTYPHIDCFERGIEAMRIVVDAASGRIKPVCALKQIPMLIGPPKQCTFLSPMRDVIEMAHEMEKEKGVISVTVAGGFPFSDFHDAGASVVVNADSDKAFAQAQADELAGKIWERREQFRVKLAPLKETIAKVVSENKGPVVFADGSDNPGGGAPCDGTVMLQALIEAKAPRSVVAIIADPESVAKAVAAGVGNEVDLMLGGKTDNRHGAPLKVKAYVKAVTDGCYVNKGPMFTGLRINMGRTAVVVAGEVEVVVTERRSQPLDMQALRSVGIEPGDRLIIGLKSAVHFRADYTRIAHAIYDMDTPGIHNPDPALYAYKKVRRPIWPLD